MMRMEITGLDALQRNLDKLRRNAEAMSGTREVPFTELFPPQFMRSRTDFGSIQEMVDASGIESPDDIGGAPWNEFVRSRTRFQGWEEMKSEAGVEYARRGLGF